MTHSDPPSGGGDGGTYQVWHRLGADYLPVANVRTANLLGAVVFTMSRKGAHWENQEEVFALLPQARSTDIGDVIVSPEQVAYEIRATAHGLVFEPIDFPPYLEQQALFAEWRHDCMAAEARDLREQFKELFGGVSRFSESSGPANDNDKHRDGGMER